VNEAPSLCSLDKACFLQHTAFAYFGPDVSLGCSGLRSPLPLKPELKNRNVCVCAFDRDASSYAQHRELRARFGA